MRDQHEVWEAIADSFDRSRNRTWQHVQDFVQAAPPGRLLDLMAGNGRHTGLACERHDTVWSDWSRPAAQLAADRYPCHVAVSDATRLPFLDHSFDSCIYVAGLHGLPTAQNRADSLAELHRVMRPGGRVQITVWSRHAPKFQNQGDPNCSIDVDIPWKSDGHDAKRHYHLYTPADFAAACMAAGFTISRAYECAIVSKKPDNLVLELVA